jgi:hypothetical protein
MWVSQPGVTGEVNKRRVSTIAGLGRHQKTPDLAGAMETVSQTQRPGSQHGSVVALSSEERAWLRSISGTIGKSSTIYETIDSFRRRISVGIERGCW